jgi:hypothetical protein
MLDPVAEIDFREPQITVLIPLNLSHAGEVLRVQAFD